MKKLIFNLLIVLIFFILLFTLLFLNVYLHENAHIREAEKLGINLKIKEIKYIPEMKNLTNWGAGKAAPVSLQDCEKFNSLDIKNKKKITHAGVNQEVVFLLIVYAIISAFSIKYCSYLWKTNKFALILLLTLNLFPIITGFLSFHNNVFSSNPAVDWNVIFLNCSS